MEVTESKLWKSNSCSSLKIQFFRATVESVGPEQDLVLLGRTTKPAKSCMVNLAIWHLYYRKVHRALVEEEENGNSNYFFGSQSKE